MIISGLQKLTLIDYPSKLACTFFLYGCNFKCGFCHNPELVVEKSKIEYSKKEIFDFLEKKKKYLEGVCITGGEPLLSLDLNFLEEIKEMGYLIKIDTNGSFPDKLKELIDKKLVDFISMDIKSCKKDYKKIICAEIKLDKIEKSIKIISDSGIDYEFRTTILKKFHNKENVKEISKWLNEILGTKPKKYVLQGFKNQGKVIDNDFLMEENTTEKYLAEIMKEVKDYFEIIEIRA